MKKNWYWFAIAIIAFVAVPAIAQTAGSLSGTVKTSSGDPVNRAEVEIVGLRRNTTTDASGAFRFDNVPSGRQLVQITSSREGTSVQQVNISGPTTLDVTLDLAVHREEIVVSAATDPRAASEVAQPIDVVSGEELMVRQQATLGETLSSQPGVTSTGFAPGASRPVIRGFGGDRIRVLEDGVGVGDASNVSQDHNVSIDPSSAESIEIVRGPATLLYGSNAVGGVVNVIDDRVPMSLVGEAISGSLDLRGSSVSGERSTAISLTGGTNVFAWHGSFNDRQTDDFNTPIGKLFNSDIDSRSASVGASLIGAHGFIGLSYSGYNSDYGISEAGPGVRPDDIVRIDMKQRRFDLKSEWNLDGGPFTRLRLRAGRTDYSHFEVVNGEPEVEFLNDSTEARLEASHRDLGPFHGAVGVQFSDRDFRVEGEEFLLPPTVTENLAFFAFEEAGTGVWRLQLGGRYETQDIEVDSDAVPDRSFSGFSGSVSGVWVPNANYTASLSLSHSSRLPVAEELYFDGPHEATFQFQVGDPDLDVEQGNGLDLSLRKRTGRVTGEFSVFTQRFDGYIFQNPTGELEDEMPVFAFAQVDANFRGAEAHADIALHHSDPNHLSLELSGDYVRAELADGRGDVPFIPPFRFGVGLRFQGQALFLLAEARHANGQNRISDFETPTPSYTMINTAIGYRFFFGQTVHDLMLRANNLTDELAYNHLNPLKDVVPMPGRDFSLSYRLAF
ncbi:MAG TPA: TonB-dependent receptor [Thermoanaerobaculia bacterium]|jgi:iron complex outermembrane receptor protein|nr:TonB-dependent receptor [Thermoanaerobaculia bacterium]